MTNPDAGPDEGLREEIEAVGRRAERKFEPGLRAVFIAVGVLALLLSAALPWVGHTSGWEVLLGTSTGERVAGFAPRLFLIVALAMGVAGSFVALTVRRYGAAWVCSLGTDASVLLGALSIWSQQTTGSHHPGPGPGPGLVLAMVSVVVLAVLWSGVAWHKPKDLTSS
jgi:hypothetical protein